MKLLAALLLLAATSCTTVPTYGYPPHVVQVYNTIPVAYEHSLTADQARLKDLYLDEVIEFTLRGVSPYMLEAVNEVPARVKLDLLEHILWRTKEPFDIVLVEVGPRYADEYYVDKITGALNRMSSVEVRATAYRTNHQRADADGLRVWFNRAQSPDP